MPRIHITVSVSTILNYSPSSSSSSLSSSSSFSSGSGCSGSGSGSSGTKSLSMSKQWRIAVRMRSCTKVRQERSGKRVSETFLYLHDLLTAVAREVEGPCAGGRTRQSIQASKTDRDVHANAYTVQQRMYKAKSQSQKQTINRMEHQTYSEVQHIRRVVSGLRDNLQLLADAAD